MSVYVNPGDRAEKKLARPSSRGLFPDEILMLYYAPKFKTSGNSFQHFWFYQYFIDDPQAVLQSLCKKGFLFENNSFRAGLEKEKTTVLKEWLQKKGAKVSGKKEDLINRILEEYTEEELSAIFPDKYYALTEQGEQELRDNEYVVYVHFSKLHIKLNIWQISRQVNSPDGRKNWRDVIWGELNAGAMKYAQQRQFIDYVQIKLSMHRFLIEEEKFPSALTPLCEAALYHLNGLKNNLDLISNRDASIRNMDRESFYKTSFPYSTDSYIYINNFLLDPLKKMQAYLNLNDDEYREALKKEFSKFSLPFSIFTNEEVADIIISEINGDVAKLKQIYNSGEARFKQKYPFQKETSHRQPSRSHSSQRASSSPGCATFIVLSILATALILIFA